MPFLGNSIGASIGYRKNAKNSNPPVDKEKLLEVDKINQLQILPVGLGIMGGINGVSKFPKRPVAYGLAGAGLGAGVGLGMGALNHAYNKHFVFKDDPGKQASDSENIEKAADIEGTATPEELAEIERRNMLRASYGGLGLGGLGWVAGNKVFGPIGGLAGAYMGVESAPSVFKLKDKQASDSENIEKAAFKIPTIASLRGDAAALNKRMNVKKGLSTESWKEPKIDEYIKESGEVARAETLDKLKDSKLQKLS